MFIQGNQMIAEFLCCLGPLHRYTFGIGWRINDGCEHSDHKSDEHSSKRFKTSVQSINRIAPFHLVKEITNFPFGGRLCCKHRLEVYSEMKERQTHQETISELESFRDTSQISQLRDEANDLLEALHQSPLLSQTLTPLEAQAPGAIRRLTAKLRRVVS
jgi:hypothetical protein